jgi:hypothetical protein
MEIIIEFDTKTGKTKIEAEGFNGTGCTAATQPFEDALGVVSDREFKPEHEGFHHHGVYRTASKFQLESRASRKN